MILQIFVIYAVTTCLALGDGTARFATKNIQQKQAPQQYASIASFHSSAPSRPRQEPQQAPSPYSFNYEADGSSREESGDASGRVTGRYSVANEDGSVRVVSYVADEQGFRADVDTGETGSKSDNSANVQVRSASKFASGRDYGQIQEPEQFEEQKTLQFESPKPIAFQSQIDYESSEFAKASPFKSAPKKAPAPSSFSTQITHQQQQKQTKMYSQPPLRQAPIQEPFNSKPSPYAFNYNAQLDDGSSSRQESSDGHGKVIGSYSLTDADGRKRIINYEADHEGFRASVDTNEFGTKSDSPADVKFLSTAPLEEPIAFKRPAFQQRQPSGIPSKFHQQSQSVKSASGSSRKFQPSPHQPAKKTDFSSHVKSQTQSRPSISNPVRPSFQQHQKQSTTSKSSFTTQRPSRPSADPSKFSQQPVQQTGRWSPDSIGEIKSSSQHQSVKSSSQTRQSVKSASSPTGSFKPAFQQTRQQPIKTALASTNMYSAQPAVQFYAGALEKPSPYAFDYFAQLDDGSSSRRESADENGRVTGSYSLTVADGRQRTVDYVADHEGFRATVNTNEFGTKEESPADVQFYSSATEDEPAPYSSPNAYRSAASSAAVSMYSPQQQDRSFGSASQDSFYQQTEEDPDEFQQNRDFHPSAPEKKFEAPRAPIAFAVPEPVAQLAQESYEPSEDMYQMPMYSQQHIQDDPSYPHYPYAFTYQADSESGVGGSSRQESSDASGKVTGQYTVTNEDGSIRVVEYVADEGGFRANVKTNEPGTKSEDPADVSLKSEAKAEPQIAQSAEKTSPVFSQQAVEDWRR